MRNPIFVVNPKAPFLAKIGAWFLLLYGIGVFLMSGRMFLFGYSQLSGGEIIFALINLIIGIGLIMVAFGFRHMKRWALDVYTVLTVIALISLFILTELHDPLRTAGVLLEILFLVYFWYINKKFLPSPTFR